MLKQRVVTAVIMALLLLAALFALPFPGLAVAFGVVVLLAGWEWSNLAGLERAGRLLFMVLLGGALAAAALWSGMSATGLVAEQVLPVMGLAGAWWALALLWVQGYPGSAGLWGSRPVRAVMGLLVLVPAWLALLWLRQLPQGPWMVVFLLALVAAADIGAYFTGRAWGRAKLAPRVSPGKSWVGLWGGLASSVLFAVAVWWWAWRDQVPLAGLLALTVVVALASVLGDLLESMVKRHRGIKDSGVLLPGHGGFMDRLDSISAAAPVFVLGLLLMGWP